MKVIIDIPEKAYELLKSKSELDNIAESIIANGTPLPKGHGDLIDRDILLQNWKVIPSRDRLIFDRYIQTLDGVIPADK